MLVGGWAAVGALTLHVEEPSAPAGAQRAARTAALSASARQELAEADRLSAQLDAGFAAGDYAAVRDGARRQLEIRRRHLGTQHPDVATTMAYLGVALQGLGEFAAAEECYRELLQALHALHGAEHPDVATILGNLATVVQERGDWLQAEALYRQVLALQRRTLGADDPELARGLNNLATLLERQGDPAGAEPLLREALESCRRAYGQDSLEAAFAAANLAEVLQARAELEPQRSPQLLNEAENLCQASLLVHQRALEAGHPDIAVALYDLALVLRAAGKEHLAERRLREALALRRSALGPDHPDVAQTLAALGSLLRHRGQVRDALAAFEEALAIDRSAYGNRHWRVVEDLTALGESHLQQGDPRRALPLLSEACDAWDVARRRAGAGLKSATVRVTSPYVLLATALLQLDRRDEAWQASERGQGRLLTELLASAGERSRHPVAAAREDSLRHALADLEGRLAALREARAGAAQQEQTRQQLLEAEAEWSTLELAADSTASNVGAPLPLERIQASLAHDEALIGWVEGPVRSRARRPGDTDVATTTWGYVVRDRGAARWIELPRARSMDATASPSMSARPGAAATDNFTALRRELAGGDAVAMGVADTPRLRELRAEVYVSRVAPLLKLAEAHGSLAQLIVVPSGRLLGIPLEALEDRPGSRTPGVLQRCAVTYVPSATAFARLREASGGARREESAPEGLSVRPSLIAGDPPAGDLPGLQWSAIEARQVAAALPNARLLLGGEASEARFDELARSGELASFGTVHLATHAVVDDVSPEQSALVLARTPLSDPLGAIVRHQPYADGRLTAREILQTWRLRADLVTLSACESGLGRRAGAEGYLGLGSAFLQVGARGVLVSLWNVDDEATAVLMERFYRLRAGLEGSPPVPAAVALRDAKLWLRDRRDSAGGQPFRHPYYWAGFVLLGEGGGGGTRGR